jgi:hypothetical protein
MHDNDPTRDPFYSGSHAGQHYFYVSAADRAARVGALDLEQCRRALAMDDLQKSVRTAVERRLRQLEREARTS